MHGTDLNTDFKFSQLRDQLDGDLYTDDAMRKIYATDASIYRQLPLAVVCPRCPEDIQTLIQFVNAQAKPIGLIPRAAGTSLAGQAIGTGTVSYTHLTLPTIYSV